MVKFYFMCYTLCASSSRSIQNEFSILFVFDSCEQVTTLIRKIEKLP